MRHSLTIYDDPVFYIQGFSNILLQKEMFSSVYHYNSQKEFVDNYKVKPTDFVIYGSHQKSVHEIIVALHEVSQNKNELKMK